MRCLITLAMLALILGGCASESTKDTTKSAPAATIDHVEEVAGTIPAAATVEGTLGCGHCTYHVGDSCSAALKTADGTIYILDGVKEDDELFQKRLDGGPVTITGTETELDGQHHMTVASYQM